MHLENDNRLQIGELPELQIVAMEDVVFHEYPDEERSGSLGLFLQKEGNLKNPPVVGTYNHDSKMILLDGANRMTALQKLGVRHVLVQKVDLFDEYLLFLHWHHAVEKLSQQDFMEKLQAIPGVCINEAEGSDDVTDSNDPHQLCQIQFTEHTFFKITAHVNLFEKVDLLNRITNIYKGSAYMDRVSYTNWYHLNQHYAQFSALVCFKKFSKQELVDIVENGSKLPSGITRIILPKRALRLNVPLDILRFEAPLEEKNHWLQQRIQLQVKDKSIRFYHEPTFLFDE